MARFLSIGQPIDGVQGEFTWRTARTFLMGFLLGETFLLLLIGFLR